MGLVLCYCFYGHTIPVGKMVNCTLGSLVSQLAITFLCTAWEVILSYKALHLPPQSIAIGGISGFIVFLSIILLDSNHKMDDPCCTFIVHGPGAASLNVFHAVS